MRLSARVILDIIEDLEKLLLDVLFAWYFNKIPIKDFFEDKKQFFNRLKTSVRST